MIQTVSPTRTREALPTPQVIENNKYCVLEYTPAQRRYLAYRHVFSSPVTLSDVARPVLGDPHAMTVSVGMHVETSGEITPYMATEHVPGVLVKSDEFVAGFHFGMCDAFDTSNWGDDPVDEREVVDTFVSIASDAVMLGDAEIPSAFSAGYLFGYMRGCTLVGTDTFQRWANGGPVAS
jgi:hypothetical protein